MTEPQAQWGVASSAQMLAKRILGREVACERGRHRCNYPVGGV
jgi:hypothetical protein